LGRSLLSVYRDYSTISAVVGSFLFLIIGFVIWINGWDPYENILDESRMKMGMINLKDMLGFVEWYKWVLKYSFLKYLSLAIMILGPYFFVYRIIFLEKELYSNMVYSGMTMCLGIVIWLISWDPYY
jgi:hypothetical protein